MARKFVVFGDTYQVATPTLLQGSYHLLFLQMIQPSSSAVNPGTAQRAMSTHMVLSCMKCTVERNRTAVKKWKKSFAWLPTRM